MWVDFDCEYLSQFLSYNGEFYIFGFLRFWWIQWCKNFRISFTGWRDIDVSHLWLRIFVLAFLFFNKILFNFNLKYLSEHLSNGEEINIFGFLRLWGIRWYQNFQMLIYGLAKYRCLNFVDKNSFVVISPGSAKKLVARFWRIFFLILPENNYVAITWLFLFHGSQHLGIHLFLNESPWWARQMSRSEFFMLLCYNFIVTCFQP